MQNMLLKVGFQYESGFMGASNEDIRCIRNSNSYPFRYVLQCTFLWKKCFGESSERYSHSTILYHGYHKLRSPRYAARNMHALHRHAYKILVRCVLYTSSKTRDPNLIQIIFARRLLVPKFRTLGVGSLALARCLRRICLPTRGVLV